MKKLSNPRVLYRMEHPATKQGPFVETDEFTDFSSRHGNALKYPDLNQESLPTGDGFFCATRNKKQLKYWFNAKERKHLNKLGYEVVKFKVHTPTKVKFTDVQCVFHKDAVEVVEILCPITLKGK